MTSPDIKGRRGTPSKKAHQDRLRRSRNRAGLISVAPAVVLIVAFFLIPLVLMFWMSLNNWPLLGSVQRYIGTQNYADIASDRMFGRSLLFTLKYVVIVTPIQLVLGYGLAMLVRRKFRGVGIFRTTYFFPVVVGFASGAYIFLVFVQPESGLFDQVMQGLGITSENLPWLSDTNLALLVVVLMITWKTVGTAVILLMVGMQAIPDEVGEAALVDGAGRWKRELYIMLPLMRSSIALVLILTVTGAFLAFDQFFVMTHGGPDQSTVTIVMWIYTTAFVQYRLGYSAALSIALLVILILFTVVQIRALRERGREA
ncbi:carbohydrate ABC transporter permease [Streptomyces rubrogriseus]|uniref:carbohydrate ABC transporter permease n=1 Tax=Streptomyces rubrogriseus TaxID=194673 RepID=UPI0037029654